MNTKRYEFVIVGGGAAGFSAAIKADDYGVKTALINSGLPLGGTCVNVGCIPTKVLLEITKNIHQMKNPSFSSLPAYDFKPDFEKIMKEKDELIRFLQNRNYNQVLSNLKNVTYIEGRAKFIANNKVEVNGETIEGKKFLIATGSSTKFIPIVGLKESGFITHKEALALKSLPESILIIGAGPIGMEFGQIFARLGSKVYIVEVADRVLPRVEPMIAKNLQKYLEKEMTIYTKSEIEKIEKSGNKKVVKIKKDDEVIEIKVEEILLAAGVKGNSENLNLENIGVNTDKNGFIKVNKYFQTAVKNIYAAGDIIGAPWLETVAAKEGNIAAQNALKNKKIKMDYSIIPYAVFTSPQVASVGVTEGEYSEKYGTCACRFVWMNQVPKALAIKQTEGLIFMVIHHKTDRIMGVHILSENASEIIHEAVIAIKSKLTIDDIIGTVHIFPTLSESIKIASQSFTRDISKMSCCIE